MPVSSTPAPRRPVAGVLAVLSCAAVLTLSACDTSSSSGSGGGGEGEHSSEHSGEHSGTRPTEHRTTVPPSSRPSEFNPNNCPTGLVC